MSPVDIILINDAYDLKSLESKNATNTIIQKLSQDFDLMPINVEAFYKKVSIYFNEHSNISLYSGKVSYEAVYLLNQLVHTSALPEKLLVTLSLRTLTLCLGVWALGTLYPKTPAGLMESYIAAIPFFQYSLIGDLFFVRVMFGVYELIKYKIPALEKVKA
jgi:hypothetical protein